MDSTAPKPENATEIPPLPAGIWNTLLTSLPIVLTILATAFAGLSSSEMTQSMYYRSLAAQYQSKAGDQWAFFQAKVTRGVTLRTTAELLRLGDSEPFDPAEIDSLSSKLLTALDKAPDAKDMKDAIPQDLATRAIAGIKSSREKLAKLLNNESIKQCLPYLTSLNLPTTESLSLPKKDIQENLDAAVGAIRRRKTEGETADLIRKINPADIEEATRLAEQNLDAFDKACAPINDTIKDFRSVLKELTTAVRPLRKSLPRSGDASPLAMLLSSLDAQDKGFTWAAQEFDSRRYRLESRLNRQAAEVYEVRVRRAGVESDRRRERSKMFFYSMLMAQAGVTIASLALARTQHKSLWLFAAGAGLIALGFSSYVYISF